MLTGNTARTAFLTTEGHPDILLFREGGRTEIFDLSVPYPEPYVPRALTFEVPERVGPDGAVLRPLDEAALRGTIARLKELDVEAVGVCLLWSIVNPAHERRVGELLEEHLPDVALTLSHELNPCLREYRRASSTCIDASLKPLMTRYIRTVEERLREAGFGGRVLIVTSAGAALDAADVAAGSDPLAELRPVDGAGGGTALHGNRRHSRDGGRRRHRRYELRRQRRAARPHPVDARELDRPAVLRAHDRVALGRRPQRRRRRRQHRARRQRRPAARRARECRCRPGAGLLRDRGHASDADRRLSVARLRRSGLFSRWADRVSTCASGRQAIRTQIGEPLGLDLHDAAAAILRIATERMVSAIEEITIHQGIDPRQAVLVGGGGAAGFNAVAIARRLGCPEVVIPATGPALSAAGALISDLARSLRAHVPHDRHGLRLRGRQRECSPSSRRGRRRSSTDPARARSSSSIQFSVEARYPHQVWELEVSAARGPDRGPERRWISCDTTSTRSTATCSRSPTKSAIEFESWHARATAACASP